MTPVNPYGRRWRKVRAHVLARDGYRCQCPGDCGWHDGQCVAYATQVDHVHALAEGGANHDPANARAICSRCNWELGQQVRARRARTRNRDRIGSRALPW